MTFCSQPQGSGKGWGIAIMRNFHSFFRMVQRRDKASPFQKPCAESFLLPSPARPFNLWKCLFAGEWSTYLHTVPKWFWRLMAYLCMQSLFAHFHFIAVSSLLSQDCSLSWWLLRLIWPAPFLFCYKYLPGTLFANMSVQRAKQCRKRAQFATYSQS